MIQYGTTDLLIDNADGEISQFMRRHLSLDDLAMFGDPTAIVDGRDDAITSGADYYVGLPVPNYPQRPPLRFNTLYWPTGAARWSVFLGLANTTQKNEILANVNSVNNGPLALTIGNSRQTAEEAKNPSLAAQNGASLIATNMYLLPPRQISNVVYSSNGTVPENIWMIPLVDVRYYWQFINVVQFDLTFSTWASVFNKFLEALGSSFTVDAVPTAYCRPDPDQLSRPYENVAILLDAVAHTVGQRVVRYLDGTIYSQYPESAAARHTNNLQDQSNGYWPWHLISGGDFSGQNDAAVTPANVIVAFPDGDGDYAGIVNVTGAALGENDTRSGMTKKIFSASKDDTISGGTGGSLTSSLATRIAQDYYDWLGQYHDYTFAATRLWQTSGFDDCVLWSMGTLLDDGTYSAQTRVISMPHNFGVDENLAQCSSLSSSSISSSSDSSGSSSLSSIDNDDLILGKADDTYAKGSIGTFSRWEGPAGAEADTGDNISAYVRMESITEEKWVIIGVVDDNWEVIQAEC